MKRLVCLSLLLCPFVLWATETEISAPETGLERQDDSTSAEEDEGQGIIPEGGLTVSSAPITPISFMAERKPYDQALEALAMAKTLMLKGRNEAASDVALQAYDDLMGVRMPRRDKKRRKQLRLDRRRAATLYIDASIAYIKDFVKRLGSNENAYREGRIRLGDLRDVALNYPELRKKVNLTAAAFSRAEAGAEAVETSTVTVTITTTTP